MELEEKHLSIQTSLRYEFEKATKERAIEIYKTSFKMGYKEQAEEMKNDIEVEFNTLLK